jgi:1-acyl-sn-glycerol-3-phosphate acyltransferase
VKFLKNILARILAFWALLIFVITMLIVILPIWITGLWKEPKSSHLMHDIFRIWMNVYFFLIGLRLKVKGKNNFEKGHNYIIVFNHNSLIDIPISTPFMPGGNKTIAKIEMAKIPLFGMLYKRGSVLVDRKNEESRRLSYLQMKDALNIGLHMCIYPEGTRNKTDKPLQHFHNGAFRLSMDTGKPIMPALIFNSAKVLPRNKIFFYWPHRIELHYLQPLSPDSFGSMETMKENIFNLMKEYYLAYQN